MDTVVNQTILETSRLLLRPLSLEDAPAMARLAGRREIADTTLAIPHPYSEDQAREWLNAQVTASTPNQREIIFASTLKEDGRLIGSIGLREIDTVHSLAEMGFWVGVDSWGQGYATEAATALLHFAFEELALNRVFACHMVRNPASGRVLEKIGMRREGLLRQRVRKWDVFEDIAILAILRQDWSK